MSNRSTTSNARAIIHAADRFEAPHGWTYAHALCPCGHWFMSVHPAGVTVNPVQCTKCGEMNARLADVSFHEHREAETWTGDGDVREFMQPQPVAPDWTVRPTTGQAPPSITTGGTGSATDGGHR